VTSVVVLASTLGQIFKPLYEAMAWIIAFFYAAIPNYAIAIALLTVTVMVITSPLTVKSTRSTIAMQRLAPEMKKLQQKYKGDRATLNEEMMKLYKEHNINPAGGCLPLLIQLPVFVVLYGVIRGLTTTAKVNGHVVARPLYIGKNTRLYHDLVAAGGQMKAFGINLADNLFSHHSSWVVALPYAAIVVVAIALQYLQMRQLNSRNPAAAQANPQMQMLQKYMPLIFAIIYLRISAAVNVYFVVSSVCRIGIQEAIFRSGVVSQAPKPGEEVLPSGRGGTRAPRRRTLMERLADAQQRAIEQQRARQAQPGLAPGTEKPRAPNPPRPAHQSQTDDKKQGATPAGEAGRQPGTVSRQTPEPQAPGRNGSNGSGAGTGQPKPSSAKPRPAGQRPRPQGGSRSSGNGAPAKKAQSQGQSRSAKKRPRKAR
jgi:YidC/Oxa1 family membrane protein insertase